MEEISKQTTKCNKCKDTSWILINGNAKRCECYEMDQLKRLWEYYGVKAEEVKKIKDYKPYDSLTSNIKSISINYINQFIEKYSKRENSFAMLGQSGAGKSHIAIAIGAQLLEKKVKVLYMPYLETMRELKARAMDDEGYIKLQSRLQQAELLIVDDLFKDKVINGELGKLTEADMKHICPILNYRYLNKLPMIINSECTPEMLANLDEALAGRIIEMCGDEIVVIEGKKYNYRMRNLRKGS